MSQSPEERRVAQIVAMTDGIRARSEHLNNTIAALDLDRLLTHLENTDQQAIADAIRFQHPLEGYIVINYPDKDSK